MMNENAMARLSEMTRACGVDGCAQPAAGCNSNMFLAWGSIVSVRRLAAVMGLSFDRRSDIVTYLSDSLNHGGQLVSDAASGRASLTLSAECAERAAG